MNIQILTSEYPNPDSTYDTPVVHYFAKEWLNKGHRIEVIYFRSVFPKLFYWIAKIFMNILKKVEGTDFIPTKRLSGKSEYCLDGVNVKSVPIFKLIPHKRYSKKTITKHVNNIIIENKKINFIPDVILGHFYNPQIEIISKLKPYYPKAKTCIVLHESPEIIKKTYPKQYLRFLNDFDIWGFRFKTLKEIFETNFGYNFKTFICHSGVPEKYIYSSKTKKSFELKVKKFCYTGMLIPLKRVCDIITALHKAFPLKDFEFNIIGEGMERENLEILTRTLELESNVKFLGRLHRDEVQNRLNDADCFIMVSESEAFGLVYLEAMAKGCITIGTRGQGIDGVINDGINGFLSEARNSDYLANIIVNINSLSKEELIEISQNAIETAQEMTDAKVADNYLRTVINN